MYSMAKDLPPGLGQSGSSSQFSDMSLNVYTSDLQWLLRNWDVLERYHEWALQRTRDPKDSNPGDPEDINSFVASPEVQPTDLDIRPKSQDLSALRIFGCVGCSRDLCTGIWGRQSPRRALSEGQDRPR